MNRSYTHMALQNKVLDFIQYNLKLLEKNCICTLPYIYHLMFGMGIWNRMKNHNKQLEIYIQIARYICAIKGHFVKKWRGFSNELQGSLKNAYFCSGQHIMGVKTRQEIPKRLLCTKIRRLRKYMLKNTITFCAGGSQKWSWKWAKQLGDLIVRPPTLFNGMDLSLIQILIKICYFQKKYPW